MTRAHIELEINKGRDHCLHTPWWCNKGNLVNSAHFKVGPLQTRSIQTISLINVVGLNKVSRGTVSRKLFNFYATFLLIKCCKETPRNSVTLYFYGKVMSRDVPICNILAKLWEHGSALYHKMPCSNILQIKWNPQRRSNTLNSRTHASSTNSLIFMRRYEVIYFLGFSNNIS